MSILNLTEVWLNLAEDPAVYASFQNVKEFEAGVTQVGEVRVMANGRLRAVRRATKSRTQELKLEMCDRQQIAWLEEHVGELVCYRDDRGRKNYAVYWTPRVTESIHVAEYGDVAITLEEVTHSEAV